MTEPIVFISRNKIKAGMAEEFNNHYRSSLPPTEAGKPDTLVQLAYESADANEVIVIRLFPSADALDAQLVGADERSKRTYEFIEPTSIEIYGTPSNSSVELMKKVAGAGIGVHVYPQLIGGFMRLKGG